MLQENPNVGWASRIIALRRRMGVSQSELGKQLNSSALAVSRWERWVQEPPANIYIQLGNITGDPDCWYFWRRAGLHSGDPHACVARFAYTVAERTLARLCKLSRPVRTDCPRREVTW